MKQQIMGVVEGHAMDKVSADDRDWFEDNPHREFRIRLAAPIEVQVFNANRWVTGTQAGLLAVVVHQTELGMDRAYTAFAFAPTSDKWIALSTADDEELARLFAYTQLADVSR